MPGLLNPAGTTILAPGTPYITPEILQAAPTGIAWQTIGPQTGTRPTPAENLAEIANICRRATSQADGYVNQILRATIDTEVLTGPGDFRCQIQTSGVTRLLMSRSPILQVLSAAYSPTANFPRTWTSIPATYLEIERPIIGVYGTTAPGGSGDGGQSLLLAPGYVTWLFGRDNTRVQVTYINGWPHTSLQANAAAAATTISVDDCTGWGPPAGQTTGAAGIVYDAGQQEAVVVTGASASSGPGTLTLSTPLVYAHADGTMVSTMPGTIMQACILLATAQALVRGATATTVQALPGSQTGPGKEPADLIGEAELLLHTYRRVI